MSQSETRAALAAETESARQPKRERAVGPPLVTGRGGAGNFRKSKQDKPESSSFTLSQPHPRSTSQARSLSVSTEGMLTWRVHLKGLMVTV